MAREATATEQTKIDIAQEYLAQVNLEIDATGQLREKNAPKGAVIPKKGY